jgi:hypothetical protein
MVWRGELTISLWQFAGLGARDWTTAHAQGGRIEIARLAEEAHAVAHSPAAALNGTTLSVLAPMTRRTGQIDRGRVKTRRNFVNDRAEQDFSRFFDSERSKASQKRTKQARVKTRGSFVDDAVVDLFIDPVVPAGEIIEAIIKDAKNNDVAARQLFVKHLMPRHRFVAEPVDLSPAKDAAKAQAQIGMLVGMAGRGELDLESLYSLSRALALAIDTRLAELEERLEEQEGREPDDG